MTPLLAPPLPPLPSSYPPSLVCIEGLPLLASLPVRRAKRWCDSAHSWAQRIGELEGGVIALS